MEEFKVISVGPNHDWYIVDFNKDEVRFQDLKSKVMDEAMILMDKKTTVRTTTAANSVAMVYRTNMHTNVVSVVEGKNFNI